jgi:hypothetical protein
MKEITIRVDDELVRKLTETAINGYHLSIEKYIVRVLNEDMNDAERFSEKKKALIYLNFDFKTQYPAACCAWVRRRRST